MQLTAFLLFFAVSALQGCSSQSTNGQSHSADQSIEIHTNVNVVRSANDTDLSKPRNESESKPRNESEKFYLAKTIGLIVLADEYKKGDFVRIYNADGTLWYEFTFYYDDSDGKFEFQNSEFLPFSFHPDHFSLALKCVAEQKDLYEVIVNEETGLRKFVKKEDKTLRFEKWPDHVRKVFSIVPREGSNVIRDSPNGKASSFPPPDAPLHPTEIAGNWIRVTWKDSAKGNQDRSGWLLWRDKNNLLIELFYAS